MKLDIERCKRAMKNIDVRGIPNPARLSVIEDAIKAIQLDGAKAMLRGYLGTKDYASWSDQRCDCEYGYGPKHGCIVFSIGRTAQAQSNNTVLGDDECYLLECVRDFGAYSDTREPLRNSYSTSTQKNLIGVLRDHEKYQTWAKELIGALEVAEVDTHETVNS